MLINGKSDLNGAYSFEKLRFCQKCDQEIKYAEPDPCIGYVPGVAHACCGHGNEVYAYCCGWPGCKPNEGPGEYGVDAIDKIPGYWDIRYGPAIEYMENLNETN